MCCLCVCVRNKKQALRNSEKATGAAVAAFLMKIPSQHNVQKLLFRNELLAQEDAFKQQYNGAAEK